MDEPITPHCRMCGEPGVPVVLGHITHDDIAFWQCTKCQNRWHQHANGWVRAEADPYVQRGKDRARGTYR